VYVSDAIQIIGSGSSLKLDQTKVGIAFTKLRFTQHRRKSGRGYWAYSGQEMRLRNGRECHRVTAVTDTDNFLLRTYAKII